MKSDIKLSIDNKCLQFYKNSVFSKKIFIFHDLINYIKRQPII